MDELDIEKVFFDKNKENIHGDSKVFWLITKPYVSALITAVVCSLVLSGINGAIAWLIKPVMDSIFLERSENFLIVLPIGVIALFFLRGLFTYLTNYLMSSVGAKIVKSLRDGIYKKLLDLPQSFYGRTASGSIVSKVFNDLEILQLTMAHTIKDFFVSGGTVIVLSIVALLRRWDLALLSFIVIPLIAYSIAVLGSKMKKTSRNTRQLISKVTVLLHESLHGMKIIKAFTMEKSMASRYKDALSGHYRNIMKEIKIKEVSALMAEVLAGAGVAIIIYYGSKLVISNQITPGSFFSFIAALLMIYTPLKRLSRVHNNFQQALTIIERVREIVLLDPEKRKGIEKEINGHIVFDEVSFSYPETNDVVIDDVSFEIKQGELIALVGHSGAGKSTLVDLVAGFWYPTSGDILIDDIPIRNLSLRSLRKHIGLVTQDVILFNDSVKANIHLGQPDASDEEIIEASKAAFAHDFIKELPDGYDTQIGERGAMLSGGQKQRLTIARAILKNPKILIFDEATSSLDSDSETKIQKAIENIIPGRTTIIIAHRLSTIRKADRILVMDRGSINQVGKHDELMAVDGKYRELYNMQFGLKNRKK